MVVLLALLALPSACGGKVRESPGEGEDLGPCVSGFPVSGSTPARPCNWLFENQCFVNLKGACACACPRSGASVCYSGMGGVDAREPVWCEAD